MRNTTPLGGNGQLVATTLRQWLTKSNSKDHIPLSRLGIYGKQRRNQRLMCSGGQLCIRNYLRLKPCQRGECQLAKYATSVTLMQRTPTTSSPSACSVGKSFITYGHEKTLREVRRKFHGNKGRRHGSQLARLKQTQ
jgi:hypothetical protein